MGLVDDFLKKIGILPTIVSPLPDNPNSQVLGVKMSDGGHATRSEEVQAFIDRVRETKPQLKNKSDEFLAGLYEKYGNSIMPPEPVKKNDTPQNVPDAVPTVDPNTDAILTNIIFPITRKYEIPDSVAAAQFAAEGRTQGLGASRNNYFNIAGFDKNLSRTQIFKTPQEGVEAYAKFVSGQGSYASEDHKKKFQQAYELRKDPQKMLKAIELAGYAGDPTTYAQRAQNNYPSYSDFAMSTPEWRKYMPQALSIDQAVGP